LAYWDKTIFYDRWICPKIILLIFAERFHFMSPLVFSELCIEIFTCLSYALLWISAVIRVILRWSVVCIGLGSSFGQNYCFLWSEKS
jgi:hypothetical protein